jgi:hypothetical protein
MKHAGFFFIPFVIAGALVAPAHGADPRYPDWPCVQPKVPELSTASMWDGPSIADVGGSWQNDPKVKDLVALIAARRTPMDAAQKAIAEFITGTADDKQQKAKEVFAGVFDTLSAQRSDVMDGLERVSRKEMDLAGKIEADVNTMHALEDKPDADQAKIKTLGDEIEWSTRIFEDRRKTIRYVCDVPTTIEQRIFALARAIEQTLN